MQNTTLNILKTVTKTCKKVLRLNMTSTIQIQLQKDLGQSPIQSAQILTVCG